MPAKRKTPSRMRFEYGASVKLDASEDLARGRGAGRRSAVQMPPMRTSQPSTAPADGGIELEAKTVVLEDEAHRELLAAGR